MEEGRTQATAGARLIRRNVKIPSHERNLPKGHRLIIGDMATVTL